MPLYVCRHCRTAAELVESKRQKLRELVQESFRKFRLETSKRPKDSTGAGVSPHTQKVQPPRFSSMFESPIQERAYSFIESRAPFCRLHCSHALLTVTDLWIVYKCVSFRSQLFVEYVYARTVYTRPSSPPMLIIASTV